jgi:hypothetical protein
VPLQNRVNMQMFVVAVLAHTRGEAAEKNARGTPRPPAGHGVPGPDALGEADQVPALADQPAGPARLRPPGPELGSRPDAVDRPVPGHGHQPSSALALTELLMELMAATQFRRSACSISMISSWDQWK